MSEVPPWMTHEADDEAVECLVASIEQALSRGLMALKMPTSTDRKALHREFVLSVQEALRVYNSTKKQRSRS